MSGTAHAQHGANLASALHFTPGIANLPLPLGVLLKGGKIVHDARSLRPSRPNTVTAATVPTWDGHPAGR